MQPLAARLIFNSNYFTLRTICKQKAVLWEPSVHHQTAIYLWIILKKKLIYRFIKEFSLIYLRFMDDIFFIWTSNKKDLLKFLKELNTKHECNKFEYQISKASITFLDTEIYIKNNKFYTKIYKKEQIVKHFSTSTLNTQNL